MSGSHFGGLGALASAVLGGGIEGTARGGAMGIIGTLALRAPRRLQATRTGTLLPM